MPTNLQNEDVMNEDEFRDFDELLDDNEVIEEESRINDTFDEKERYHIKSLSIRKEVLEAERKRHNKLDVNKREELEALKWVLKLIDEISYG
jgi:hypothetical protein